VDSCTHAQDLFTSLLDAVGFDLALLTYANICWVVRVVPLVMSVDKMQIAEKVTWG